MVSKSGSDCKHRTHHHRYTLHHCLLRHMHKNPHANTSRSKLASLPLNWKTGDFFSHLLHQNRSFPTETNTNRFLLHRIFSWCQCEFLLIKVMLLVDWLSHLTGSSVCWGCHVVSLQIRHWKWGGEGGGGGALHASLLGSSCLLISSEQMEESPHLTGDRFHPTSSNNSGSNLTFFLFFLSSTAAGGCHPPQKRWRRRRKALESLEKTS